MFGLGFSKEKSRANAERYLQQNKLPNAISEYEKILKVEPRDYATLNTVGDIYARLGQNEKAIERFRVVGESYTADGLLPKSIAMYKKITKLDPNGLPAMEKLAELYRKQGLVSDARSMLLQAAEAYTRKGQSKETLRLLKQLVLFDPENVQVITRTADLMTQNGQKNEAKEMLSQTAATLVQRHALDPAQKILERLLALDRSNLRAQELRAQVTLELGDAEKAVELYEAIPDLETRIDGLHNLLAAYLKLGKLDEAILVCRKLLSIHHDPDAVLRVAARLYKENDTVRALGLYDEFSTQVLAHDKEDVMAHLHGAVSRVRDNPDALQILYTLFQRAGESSMLAEILELLANACVQNSQFERARDAYKELIELEPENASHIQGYRQVCAHFGPVAAPAPVVTSASGDGPRTLEEFLTSDEPTLPEQSYPPQVEEQIANALTEAELCESFSSKTLGITALELALRSAPDDLRLNRTLALLYRQEGQLAKATACNATLHRVLHSLGESEAAERYANRGGSEQTIAREAETGEFTVKDFDLDASFPDLTGSTEEIDLSDEWESVWQDAPVEPAVPYSKPSATASSVSLPVVSSTASEASSELLEEVHFCLAQQIWPEAESAISRLTQACPEHPELPALRDQLRQHRPAPILGGPVRTAAPSTPLYGPVEIIEVSDDLLSMKPSAHPVSTPPAPSLSSFAAELDFELGDGFVPATPPRPVVSQRPQEVVPTIAAAVDAPVLQAAALPSEEAIVSTLSPSVFGDLLQDFERDLAAPEENNDPETHFNLGMAFRDMGLLDEAIGELQKVCRMAGHGLTAERTQQAYIWLATCFVEKSVPEASFKWFLRALEAAPDEEAHTAVNYELASAYEAAGRKGEALDHFMEVYGTNIDYRDVASRIRELRSAS